MERMNAAMVTQTELLPARRPIRQTAAWEIPRNRRRTPAAPDDLASYVLSLPGAAALERERLANEEAAAAHDRRLRVLLAKTCRVLGMDLPFPAETTDHRHWLERLGIYLDVDACQLSAATHLGEVIIIDPYPPDVWILAARLHGPSGLLAECLRVRSAVDLVALFVYPEVVS